MNGSLEISKLVVDEDVEEGTCFMNDSFWACIVGRSSRKKIHDLRPF